MEVSEDTLTRWLKTFGDRWYMATTSTQALELVRELEDLLGIEHRTEIEFSTGYRK